ncbi:MAG TPA: energy transducer TonB, partial [Verrucomicrobiales bacterium]|nr:energy transducer TonB [Verrucomicrobiales bacterium]
RSPSTASSTILARPNPSQNSAPTYPDLARKKGWTGSVLLRAQISAQGIVESLTILKSSGYEILDQSATRAVRQWRFYPQEVGGAPTSSTVEIPVKFSLKH